MQDGQQGQVIKPGDQPGEQPAPTVTTPEPPAAVETPAPQPQVSEPETASDPVSASTGSLAHVEWTASEYIANPKSAGWFATLIFASVIFAAVAYLVTKDMVSIVVIIVLGIIVGVFAARQPQVLRYKVDSQGIYIGEKFYPYISFKSFSIAQEHALGYISLMPLKRFMPPLAIHYAPEDEDRIANTLADYLPYEEHKPDIADSLARRFRF